MLATKDGKLVRTSDGKLSQCCCGCPPGGIPDNLSASFTYSENVDCSLLASVTFSSFGSFSGSVKPFAPPVPDQFLPCRSAILGNDEFDMPILFNISYSCPEGCLDETPLIQISFALQLFWGGDGSIPPYAEGHWYLGFTEDTPGEVTGCGSATISTFGDSVDLGMVDDPRSDYSFDFGPFYHFDVTIS